jgi:hypothetical protein
MMFPLSLIRLPRFGYLGDTDTAVAGRLREGWLGSNREMMTLGFAELFRIVRAGTIRRLLALHKKYWTEL